ncbi:heat shock factor -type DNA-binding domain-containing protein [Reticulomyxa filosa]|uniref:Heat shock factor-type DNA-binding domain-containing protein n=1 Tax=Reticulomyxa filosa TaxID=46433 RepID=X6MW22_RETFI|nr:heat shock factor -type DNA-binding domain-containing protein [Reticulomyxa filosa]|eukprot:ETO17662.1 heat shock factor -type DNA-binding domain-containing protein [Reticulomyxa filosa]
MELFRIPGNVAKNDNINGLPVLVSHSALPLFDASESPRPTATLLHAGNGSGSSSLVATSMCNDEAKKGQMWTRNEINSNGLSYQMAPAMQNALVVLYPMTPSLDSERHVVSYNPYHYPPVLIPSPLSPLSPLHHLHALQYLPAQQHQHASKPLIVVPTAPSMFANVQRSNPAQMSVSLGASCNANPQDNSCKTADKRDESGQFTTIDNSNNNNNNNNNKNNKNNKNNNNNNNNCNSNLNRIRPIPTSISDIEMAAALLSSFSSETTAMTGTTLGCNSGETVMDVTNQEKSNAIRPNKCGQTCPVTTLGSNSQAILFNLPSLSSPTDHYNPANFPIRHSTPTSHPGPIHHRNRTRSQSRSQSQSRSHSYSRSRSRSRSHSHVKNEDENAMNEMTSPVVQKRS